MPWGRRRGATPQEVTMPAHKKDPSVRARRNKAATASTLHAVADDERSPIPALPPGREWHPATAEWWIDVWSSPMAREWDGSDVHNVTVCALLYNDIWTAETAKARKEAATEFRLQRQALGLTPYDRRRLEWTIETAEESKDRGRARRERSTPPVPRAGDDPRTALSVV
jgi:hypothetical protein